MVAAYPKSPPADTGRRLRISAAVRGASAGLLLCASAVGARAQILENYLPAQVLQTNTFLEQPLPDFVSPGVRAGSFILRPQASESIGYDSNVLGVAHGAGSPRFDTSASLSAGSDWSRDALSTYFNVDNVQTPSVNNASYTDYTASVYGALDIGNDKATGSYTYLQYALLPGDVGSLGLTQVLPVTSNDLRGEYDAQFARVTIIPNIDISTFRYNTNGQNSAGQIYVYYNANIYTPSLSARYELAPQRDLVFVVRGSSAQYETKQPGFPGRNYIDLQFLAGIDFAASAVFRYRALVGYETRSYASSQISNGSAPIVEASAIWTPSRLTTVNAVVSHHIENALETEVYNYTYTDLRVSVDHELRRNVLIEGYGDVEEANYSQQGGNQTILGGGASIAWLLNRNVRLRASVDLTDAKEPPNGNYTRNVFLLQLLFRL
jgi:hypothetical protein